MTENSLLIMYRKHADGFLSCLSAEDVFIVRLSGKECPNLQSYLRAASERFGFPITSGTADSYNDWLCDLSWIKQKTVVLVINDFDAFLSGSPADKEKIIRGFKDTILPWWEHYVLEYAADVPQRPFYVLCVTEDRI